MWREHLTEIAIVTALFAGVAVVGFAAGRWRRPHTMQDLDEWGLGGRRFGTWATWFVLGGDLYTAYTFVALPALLFAVGAAGFFAVPYAAIVYPLVYLVLVRLWSVSRRHGFVTAADFVRSRFQSPTLALLVAVTGIVATMPFIALQLVGIEAVLTTMGLAGGSGISRHVPIILAFAILAAFTYRNGLRAPALVAFVKDILIYVVVLTAVVYLPIKLGGWGTIFDAADAKFSTSPAPGDGLLLHPDQHLHYLTIVLGSALALFLYPHTITGVLISRNRNVIARNMSALPAYSMLLGLIALLGFAAIAAGVTPARAGDGGTNINTIVPLLFDQLFPDWFAGVAFAAITIGALVPAAIMSIAAANLFTRNIYREYLRRDATPEQETRIAQLMSLIVKVGAVTFVVFIDPQFSIDLQLIGGVIILQTLPSVGLGLFTRWLHRGALIAGLAAGMGLGLWMLYQIPNATTRRPHFGGSAFPLSDLGLDTPKTIYVGFVAVTANLLVAVFATVILRAADVSDGGDGTRPGDYHADTARPATHKGAPSTEPDPAVGSRRADITPG
jgi:SSS family solute:Na+ symporter